MSEDAPHYGPMTEQRAREILGEAIEADGLGSLGEYLAFTFGGQKAVLDGRFTADELEAIAWWMRNKAPSPTRLVRRTDAEGRVVEIGVDNAGIISSFSVIKGKD